ncbi:MAG: hypothetical protein IT210_24985 [Armatimonadetes bacterium]|nr:hypothetical protein [Armatimonadota bacterium]
MNPCKHWLRFLAASLSLLCLASFNAVSTQAQPVAYPLALRKLREAARSSEHIGIVSAGASKEGRDIPLVVLRDPQTPVGKTVRILVLCRQHGDEAASTEAALQWLARAAGGKEAELIGLLRRVSYFILPVINPDGMVRNRRDNAAGVDLNRDWGVFSQPETRAVRSVFRKWRPQIVVDMHEWTSRDPHYRNMVEAPGPETPVGKELGHIARRLQQEALARLESHGKPFDRIHYRPVSNPRLAHRYFAAQGRAIAFLFETQPQAIPSMPRRTALYRSLLLNLGRLLNHHATLKGDLDRLQRLTAWQAPPLPESAFPPRSEPRPPWQTAAIWSAILAYAMVLFAVSQRQSGRIEAHRRLLTRTKHNIRIGQRAILAGKRKPAKTPATQKPLEGREKPARKRSMAA